MTAFTVRARRFVTTLIVFGLACFPTACGKDNPAGPSATNIAGTWSGTMSLGQQSGPITLSLAQVDQNVSGTWVLRDSSGFVDSSGTISGEAASGRFGGTMTLSGCENTVATISGSAGGGSMAWTSPGFVGPGGRECSQTTPGFSIDVQRQ